MSFLSGLGKKMVGSSATKRMAGSIEAASQKALDRAAVRSGKLYSDIGTTPATNVSRMVYGTKPPGKTLQQARAERLSKPQT